MAQPLTFFMPRGPNFTICPKNAIFALDMECNDASPKFVRREKFVPEASYLAWVEKIKKDYIKSRQLAAIKINQELLQFYWSFGIQISMIYSSNKYGMSFFDQLSLDLRDTFSEQKGFSSRNLRYIYFWTKFYSSYLPGNQKIEILQQVAAKLGLPSEFDKIPWYHHVIIATKSTSLEEAEFYIVKSANEGWSRRKLEDEIKSNLYLRQGKALTNFKTELSEPQRELAQEVLKDPYNFDFLSLTTGYDERTLENSLIKHITRFLLELGTGFAFVGRQMELKMPGGQTFFPDLIFYHIKLKCYVVVELKVTKFEPEFAGKMSFYVTAVDNLLKSENDNQTIGLLICKSKDDLVVKWTFEEIDKPIGVASYIDELSPLSESLRNCVFGDKNVKENYED